MSFMTLDYEQFDYDHLKRVVPIAETRVFDEITVTVMSLELYAAGFIVNLLHGGVYEPDPDRRAPLGMTVLDITDDRGQTYEVVPRAGFGGGRNGVMSNTDVFVATPQLAPDVGRLSFEMRLVTHMSHHPERGVEYAESDVVGGPWEFDIVVPPDPDQGMEWPELDILTPVPTIDGDLLRVVPVGQRRGDENASVTVYSLELFEDGFTAVARVDWVSEGYGMPRLRWLGRDDLGGEYRCVNRAGGGGGREPDRRSWRMSFMFRPAIDSNASTLTLEIPGLELVQHGEDPHAPGQPDITVEGRHGGPWTFEIDLGASPGDRSQL